MKVQKVTISPYDESWIVLDNNYEPVTPITEFIKYLRNVDKSPCTCMIAWSLMGMVI